MYIHNLLGSLLLGNMKTDKNDAYFVQYSLKPEICAFVVILFRTNSRTSKNRTNYPLTMLSIF
ncbi:hypothetical protein YTPLAS73_01750 [Nitrosarchaeum sp.]|nr:hypothetical protein YTPLAS73_01750 [Nitrosarchaeum sp.]